MIGCSGSATANSQERTAARGRLFILIGHRIVLFIAFYDDDVGQASTLLDPISERNFIALSVSTGPRSTYWFSKSISSQFVRHWAYVQIRLVLICGVPTYVYYRRVKGLCP